MADPRKHDRTREAVDDVRRSASSLLDETRRDGKRMLDQQKDTATDQVGAVAGALRSAADDLHRRDDDRAGRFVEYAADRLESFGNTVRHKDIDSLIHDAERLGRRSPALFFAGSVALGFLLSRFLKSSAQGSADSDSRHRDSDAVDRMESNEAAAAAPWPSGPAEPVGAARSYPAGTAETTGTATEVRR